jgi:hypothetical protein
MLADTREEEARRLKAQLQQIEQMVSRAQAYLRFTSLLFHHTAQIRPARLWA